MAGNRKAAEQELISVLEHIVPGSENTRIYTEIMSAMSDDDFEKFIEQLESGQRPLAIICPELDPNGPTVERNLDIADKWGHKFFERIWMDPQNGSSEYLSNDEYLVVNLPLKRQAQFLIKKISIPEDNKSIDNLTGQPTGKSKGSRISWPELQILASLGEFDNTIEEFIKMRGGDLVSFNAMNHMVSTTGGVSLKAIEGLGGKVKSVQSLSTLLTAMHIANTLN